jgi:ribosomal protein L40E
MSHCPAESANNEQPYVLVGSSRNNSYQLRLPASSCSESSSTRNGSGKVSTIASASACASARSRSRCIDLAPLAGASHDSQPSAPDMPMIRSSYTVLRCSLIVSRPYRLRSSLRQPEPPLTRSGYTTTQQLRRKIGSAGVRSRSTNEALHQSTPEQIHVHGNRDEQQKGREGSAETLACRGCYAASSFRDARFRSCGSRKRLRMRTTLGVTSTSSSSWM